MPSRKLLYHFLGRLSSLERCPWLNGRPGMYVSLRISLWLKILIASTQILPKTLAIHFSIFPEVGIKETDKLPANSGEQDRPVTYSTDVVWLVACNRNKRKYLIWKCSVNPAERGERESCWRDKENVGLSWPKIILKFFYFCIHRFAWWYT